MPQKRIGGMHRENHFQQERMKAGLSQSEVAEALNCAIRSVQRYESGKTNPSLSIVIKMMQIYHCSFSDLFPNCISKRMVANRKNKKTVSHRTPMRVSDLISFSDYTYGSTVFPVCPRCKCSMERDYQRFCDRCGQALDWRNLQIQ